MSAKAFGQGVICQTEEGRESRKPSRKKKRPHKAVPTEKAEPRGLISAEEWADEEGGLGDEIYGLFGDLQVDSVEEVRAVRRII